MIIKKTSKHNIYPLLLDNAAVFLDVKTGRSRHPSPSGSFRTYAPASPEIWTKTTALIVWPTVSFSDYLCIVNRRSGT